MGAPSPTSTVENWMDQQQQLQQQQMMGPIQQIPQRVPQKQVRFIFSLFLPFALLIYKSGVKHLDVLLSKD